jgi:hypothetical protein
MDYSGFQSLAAEQVADKGVDIVIRCSSPGTYNPVTDVVDRTETDYDGKILITDYTSRDIDGSVIQVGDRLGLLSPHDTDGCELPNLNLQADVEFLLGTELLNVLRITSLKPGDTNLLYKLQIRGGAGG